MILKSEGMHSGPSFFLNHTVTTEAVSNLLVHSTLSKRPVTMEKYVCSYC